MKDLLTKEERNMLRSNFAGKVYDFGANLLKNGVKGEKFEYIMQGGSGITNTAKKQRQEWIDQATRRMEEVLEPQTLKEVREKSACCLGGMRGELTKQIHDNNPTFIERYQALQKERRIIGGNLWEENGKYYISFWWGKPAGGYPCSCLQYIPKTNPMTKTWCMCCGGHIKHHFENALGVKAEVNVVSSSLNSCGEQPCTFEFNILEHID